MTLAELKRMFGGGMSSTRQIGMIGILVAIVVLFQALTNGGTLNPNNLIAVVSQYSYILILAIGMVMVIICGHIDLSVGSVAAFVGIVVAKLVQSGLPWPAATLAGLVVGALIGAWHGFWVAYMGVPAFIVTLAGLLFFRGANQFVGDAETIPVPDGFRSLGAGYLPEVGPDTGYNNLTLLLGVACIVAVAVSECRTRRRQRRRGLDPAPPWVSATKVVALGVIIGYGTLLFASGRVGTSFPISGVILLILGLAYAFLMRHTIFGRAVYAVGGNAHAAELSGVPTKRVSFLVMMNMSTLAALAGMIYVARAAASGPQDGLNWEFDAISAVFIGGAAVAGGVGTVSGSIVGGLVMAFLNNGLQLLGVGTDQVQMIKGLVILAAVAADIHQRRRGRDSPIERLLRTLRRPRADMTPTPRTSVSTTTALHLRTSGPPMRKRHIGLLAITLALIAALTSCGASGRQNSSQSASSGFEKGSLIGVALPAKTSENWVIAGDSLTTKLQAAGYTPDVQYASSSGTVADQQAQIQAMITRGAKVIVIGAADGSQLSSQVEAAHAAGIPVIAFDRLIKNTAAVDYYVAADNRKVGELMGRALLDGMRKRDPNGAPYTIEIFSGSPDDANSTVYYDGAMSVLQPEIDAGRIRVGSGQTEYKQTAIEGWKPENAQRRMDSLLVSTYGGNQRLDGVLAPADVLSRAIITSIAGAGRPVPVVTGHDAEAESVKLVMSGSQDSTVYSDPTTMVANTVEAIEALSTGQTPKVNDTTSYDNDVKVVPAILNPPLTVTRDTAAQILGDDPLLGPLVK